MSAYGNAPCYKCEERELNCHSFCKKYKEYERMFIGIRYDRRQNQIASQRPKRTKSSLSESATVQHRSFRKKKEKLFNKNLDKLKGL